jgi:structural maintenance of chromosome 2
MAKEQQKLQQQLSDSNVERKKMENEVVISAVVFLLYN